MTKYAIVIKNCNNIDNAQIFIEKNKLNIKYGVNGTGKSTLSKALNLAIDVRESGFGTLDVLKPFKNLGRSDENPFVGGIEEIRSIKIFNERYIEDFLFKPKDLVEGSFNIFIENEEYKAGLAEIDDSMRDIKKRLVGEKEIDMLITDFTELSNSFGSPVKNGIHGASNLSRAFSKGNKVENIPRELDGYEDHILSKDNFKWIKWHFDGQAYRDVSIRCPFCTTNFSDKKEKIKQVSKVYDARSIEYLNKIVSILQRLSKYFAGDTQKEIEKFIKNPKGYSDEEIRYLLEIKSQIDNLTGLFKKTKELGFVSLKEVDKVKEELNLYKINMGLYNHLKSSETERVANIVNEAIDETLKKVGDLQGKINKQKKRIEDLIRDNKKEINLFLKNAGYEYNVNLREDKNKDIHLILCHNNNLNEITEVKEHLSFGERNAFALVLFMYDVIKNNPDLVILDDPISSFDKNKKYAIIEMLFKREKCLKGRTVLLLTHDLEPIIDMEKVHRDIYGDSVASFLENSKGDVTEKEITCEDIKSVSEICKNNIENSQTEVVSKLVYLRRLFEIRDMRGPAYNLLSSLLHKKDSPTIKTNQGEREMLTAEIELATKDVDSFISNFDYNQILSLLKSNSDMKRFYLGLTNNYEKLHAYRIIFDGEISLPDTIKKFINESFHIENDYIYQLNPQKYQVIPQFVINQCDQEISNLQ